MASVAGDRRFFADSGCVNLDGATFRSLAALSSSLPLWKETGDSFLFPAGCRGESFGLRRTPRRTASQLLSRPPFQLVHKIGFAPRTPCPARFPPRFTQHCAVRPRFVCSVAYCLLVPTSAENSLQQRCKQTQCMRLLLGCEPSLVAQKRRLLPRSISRNG